MSALCYLAVSTNSVMKLNVRSRAESGLHFHEGKFEKHESLVQFTTYQLFWLSFVKEIITVFFFTQTKVIGPWKQIGVWQRIINVIYGLSTCIFFPSQRYTSCSGHEEVCQLLLKQGGDVNAQTRSGKVSSPHRAAYSGHMSVINLLIKYGADPRLCDSDGPFHKVIMKLLWFEMNVGQSGSI